MFPNQIKTCFSFVFFNWFGIILFFQMGSNPSNLQDTKLYLMIANHTDTLSTLATQVVAAPKVLALEGGG